MNYNTTTLPNGLRIIQLPNDSPVVYCGYQIKAGARDEQPGEDGLAHFCEHVTFKGTKKRNAWNILNYLESVGGSLNAYTTKENTVFYAAIPREYTRRAIDLLTDIVFNSVYPQKEIDKEVEVICDEIESYNDSPADLIYDDFENILFKGHPLGHNILGTTDRVRSFKTEDAMRFTHHFYRPDNAVFFMYGSPYAGASTKSHGISIPKLITKEFAQLDGRSSNENTTAIESSINNIDRYRTAVQLPEGDFRGQVITRNRDTHQAHVMIGNVSYNGSDDQLLNRMSLSILNNMLGGRGMNSRLNIVLREHRGLVYTVESTMTTYSDAGLWCTYLGCDEKDVKRCLRLVHRELDKFRNKQITERQLNAAKKQLKGQISIDCDNRENFALDFGAIYLNHRKERSIEEIYHDIDMVTVESMQKVAKEAFDPDKMTTLIYK